MEKTQSVLNQNQNFSSPETKRTLIQNDFVVRRKRGRPKIKIVGNEDRSKVGTVVPNRGRPLKWTSPTALKKRIKSYFEYCDENKVPYTMSGLALALEITRSTLLRYETLEYYGYGDIIGMAETKIENYMEKRLFEKKQCIGAIFALKNNFPGWMEKQETKITGPLGPILDQIHASSKKLIGEKK